MDNLFMDQEDAANIELAFNSVPHWSYFISQKEVTDIYNICVSASLATNFDAKKKMIDEIMNRHGFVYMAGGTNRIVYKHLDFPDIVAKVATDKVGLGDNPKEMQNQFTLYPYCTRMYSVDSTGVLGIAERAIPIRTRYEFCAYILPIYIIIVKMIGEYVLEDIGTKYFKNWGIRAKDGTPVLVDYPYLYRLDGSKLYCNQPSNNDIPCGGEIDYDAGYNHLYCKKCGKLYNAVDLALDIKNNQINKFKGGAKPMLVRIIKGDKVIASGNESDSIVKPNKEKEEIPNQNQKTCSRIVKGKKVIAGEGSDRSETISFSFDLSVGDDDDDIDDFELEDVVIKTKEEEEEEKKEDNVVIDNNDDEGFYDNFNPNNFENDEDMVEFPKSTWKKPKLNSKKTNIIYEEDDDDRFMGGKKKNKKKGGKRK